MDTFIVYDAECEQAFGPFTNKIAASAYQQRYGGIVVPISRKGIDTDYPLLDRDYMIAESGVWLTVGGFAVRLKQDLDTGDATMKVWRDGHENGGELATLTLRA